MTRCYGCKRLRDVFHYLCGDCFDELPPAEQAALWARHDRTVVPLLRRLYDQLEQDVPLKRIRVTGAARKPAEVSG